MTVEINYEFIGWCHEQNHDKVWGVIKLGQKSNDPIWVSDFLVFWGRRGKKLQTKLSKQSNSDILRLIDSKIDRGYKTVDRSKLSNVYPAFQDDLEKTAAWSLLCR